MTDEEERPRRPKGVAIGGDLAALSVDELAGYLGVLKAEIVRVEAEAARRHDVRRAAEAFFKPAP